LPTRAVGTLLDKPAVAPKTGDEGWDAVDSTSQTSIREADQHGGTIGHWPLLARLPDVSEALPVTERLIQAPSVEPFGYRIDPPQAAGARHHAIRATVAGAASPPHSLPHRPRMERRPRPLRQTSPVLPQSNPFTIPRPSLLDTIAPVVRFVTLVALFAAAGTWFQLVARRNAPASKPDVPTKTSVRQPIQATEAPREKSASQSTAAGPLGATARRAITNNQAGYPTAVANSTSTKVVAAQAELAADSGVTLPRLRTAERADAGTTIR
jgi:hypothetical protein